MSKRTEPSQPGLLEIVLDDQEALSAAESVNRAWATRDASRILRRVKSLLGAASVRQAAFRESLDAELQEFGQRIRDAASVALERLEAVPLSAELKRKVLRAIDAARAGSCTPWMLRSSVSGRGSLLWTRGVLVNHRLAGLVELRVADHVLTSVNSLIDEIERAVSALELDERLALEALWQLALIDQGRTPSLGEESLFGLDAPVELQALLRLVLTGRTGEAAVHRRFFEGRVCHLCSMPDDFMKSKASNDDLVILRAIWRRLGLSRRAMEREKRARLGLPEPGCWTGPPTSLSKTVQILELVLSKNGLKYKIDRAPDGSPFAVLRAAKLPNGQFPLDAVLYVKGLLRRAEDAELKGFERRKLAARKAKQRAPSVDPERLAREAWTLIDTNR